MAGDETQHVVRNRVLQVIAGGLLLQDGDSMLEVGRADVGNHAPLKATNQTRLKSWNLAGRAVACQHDLPAGFVHGVEGMEELLLGRLLAAQKMDVVDEEKVRLTVASPEVMHRALGDRRDDVVGELLGCDKDDAACGCSRKYFVCDGLHEVCFPQSRGAVNEEGVIGFSGRLSDGRGSSSRELVGSTNHEFCERIATAKGAQNDPIVARWWHHTDATNWHKEVHLTARQALGLHREPDSHRVAKAHGTIALEQ